MAAGERHARNYHAWNHARQALRLVIGIGPETWGSEQYNRLVYGFTEEYVEKVVRDSVKLVHKWCLTHPSDVSAWAFLAFLLRTMAGGGTRSKPLGRETARKAIEETREFARKYEWKGESVTWFLKAVDTSPSLQR